ncbi:D-ribose pyranase [Tatumella sp. JGM118]|uniref:D-ribose pyranase n=1 Tax=Tatumella terrea TaxID=419007 RepID=A0ABW1VV71_9GAMM|nr:D-ribose pyranase [Tatumella sp. JGM118]MBS0909474.1 D-ribose pyranase [Tatumella sp. JGM118]
MKKGTLLNSEISSVVSRLGHTDSLTISDAGLPVPRGPQRIDLALTAGVPGFLQVVAAVTDEMQVESAILAEEILLHNVQLHSDLIALMEHLQHRQGNTIDITYMSHQQFKERTQSSQAIVRSGECSPYANIILNAGVTF